MEYSLSSIQALVSEIKGQMFSTVDLYTFVSPSAYDTAFLAMIPNPNQPDLPMFKCCLDWILNTQKEEWFWGESTDDGRPTIDSFPATLACMIALKTWNTGVKNIKKGLAFIHANLEMLLEKYGSCPCPRWFAIVFPAMVELAEATGLDLLFHDKLNGLLANVLFERQCILEREELVDEDNYPPLLAYLEALPSTYDIKQEDMLMHLTEDGSLFQSPSATAHAYMVTGNRKCMDYLVHLVQKCPHGVPSIYPMDEELIKLCMVDQIQRLGLARHFNDEIEETLSSFYRATDLAFSGEWELEEARSFSRKLLEKTMTLRRTNHNDLFMFPNFQRVIEHELSLPWMARLDHLDHRMWIEENKVSTIWIGKAAFYRWSKYWGLTNMGFGREKTIYCYFAASSSLLHNSLVRMTVAKSTIVVTIADDFYDMEGSLDELQQLTEAVQKWEGKGLSGHGKTIFEALDHLVSDIAAKHLQQQERDITQDLRDIKELEVGKMNLVLLYLKENPQAEIEESIAYVRKILDEKKKELLKIVLVEGSNDLPKSCNHLHLSCLKICQMFYNSSNLFDSDIELLQDVMKAIYVPL
ncbi:hypothetical protein F0562_014076 [Nyssa sinensis]|uniref:Uncharacterized protein n=1 Tax=Nyssa sinensis TaxID=561372 RepID=A0A5J4ZPQ2_9ASTE|nr:hypothetical protein F0562_014076 [Nyssa sinensis]